MPTLPSTGLIRINGIFPDLRCRSICRTSSKVATASSSSTPALLPRTSKHHIRSPSKFCPFPRREHSPFILLTPCLHSVISSNRLTPIHTRPSTLCSIWPTSTPDICEYLHLGLHLRLSLPSQRQDQPPTHLITAITTCHEAGPTLAIARGFSAYYLCAVA